MTRYLKSEATFGTAPVFFTAISTILGAILFLRFGYAVGNVGFVETLLIILFAHLVTIPTGMAIAEIATNQRVRGGGEYYIMSRSFGINVGASIGIALYLSQAISVAFYLIAFAEAFDPVFHWINATYDLHLVDKRIISLPAIFILSTLMLYKGANMGMSTLYIVVAILAGSLISFFLGTPTDAMATSSFDILGRSAQHDDFFKVFAICFPAFTGMTAGVGLSGDLRDPKKSIPIGTLAATFLGMIIYVFIAYKLAHSATPDELAGDYQIMEKISIFPILIPIGLAAATISSAIGSILVAPRTLQAIAKDRVIAVPSLTKWLAKGKKNSGEPFNATLVTSAIAIFFISLGNVDTVAQVISMFFMLTYGTICLISFLQHFAADPAYRPAFRSRWYISLLGFVLTVYLMFKMEPLYALISFLVMIGLYYSISLTRKHSEGVAKIFQGVIFQINRKLQIFLQASEKDSDNWRPSFICISRDFFKRPAAFDLMSWIAHRAGFGTFLYFIEGYLSKETTRKSKEVLERLVKISGMIKSNVFVDTMISPSFTSAVAQAIQLPSVSGKEINAIMFEYSRDEPTNLPEIIDNIPLVKATDYDVCVLCSSQKGFGIKRSIHIWITPGDIANGSLMILLGYVILGHPSWKRADMKISAVFPENEIADFEQDLRTSITNGMLPITAQNIELIEQRADVSIKKIINQRSQDDDLVMIGLKYESLKQRGTELFEGFEDIGNVLFVHTAKEMNLEVYENEK